MEPKTTDHSLVSLLRELRDETSTLLRQEIALAKAETAEKARRVTRNAIAIGIGAVVALCALVFLLLGCRDLIAAGFINGGMEPTTAAWLSSFIIAVVVGAIGAGLIAKGKKALAEEELAPRKTIESLREDQRLIKQKLAHT